MVRTRHRMGCGMPGITTVEIFAFMGGRGGGLMFKNINVLFALSGSARAKPALITGAFESGLI